jgi:crotonobetainyl-CoA:carnitine CoA-transferase CaiB-like acyl-CoA transferase
MVWRPLAGIKVLEVSQYTFAPAAGAILADWGAEVIKVEHAEYGDAQRGIRGGAGGVLEGSFHPLMEGSNRGKRSIGLSLGTPVGAGVLTRLARASDVFITNFLPGARKKLSIDPADLRAMNPGIIYVRATANGARGPDAHTGGYDRSAFWARAGTAAGTTPVDSTRVIDMPTGGYGDNMGAMTIAGGIAAALLARERSGQPSTIDVSLLGVGTWVMSLGVNNALLSGGVPVVPPLADSGAVAGNPLVGYFRTSDDRWINFCMLQPGEFWADVCRHLSLERLIDDPRFEDAARLMTNSRAASKEIEARIREESFDFWLECFRTLRGVWAPVQNALDLGRDPQVRANGYIVPVVDADGRDRELVASPVQFDERPPEVRRAPLFAEDTDDVLTELGFDMDEIIEMKIDGAVT